MRTFILQTDGTVWADNYFINLDEFVNQYLLALNPMLGALIDDLVSVSYEPDRNIYHIMHKNGIVEVFDKPSKNPILKAFSFLYTKVRADLKRKENEIPVLL